MKKTVLILLVAMMLSLAVNTVNAKPVATNPETTAAIKLYKSGNYIQSYLELKKIISKDSSNALAYYYLGMTSVHLGKKDEAVDNYNKAAELSPNGVLGQYAKKGLICINEPEKCHLPNDSLVNESEEDRFIRGAFGDGFSNEAKSILETEKIKNIQREINRNEELDPQRFKDFKNFSSQGLSDKEIADAWNTLQRAGLLNNRVNMSALTDFNNNSNYDDYEILNMFTGRSTNNFSNLNPQVIQALLINQMTSNL